MRIALLHWSLRKVGGAEVYLEELIRELCAAGNELCLFFDAEVSGDRQCITLPPAVERWCLESVGPKNAIQALRDWRPDFIFNHGMSDLRFVDEALTIAPGVFSVHAYYGTCISGTKAFSFPVHRPCHRTFGWPCLANFYPRRCGGLNPLTLWKDFRLQRVRSRHLRKYTAVIAYSDHMRDEVARVGVPEQKVFSIPYPVPWRAGAAPAPWKAPRGDGSAWKLLFLGRMDRLKGGDLLLDALPEVRRRLMKPISLTLAGDGPCRVEWEARAKEICRADPRITTSFTGWVEDPQVEATLQRHHLLVVPSLWPEPVGIVGIEAAARGMPTVTFAAGGAGYWCLDGSNGHLADANPPTARALADAICKSLESESAFTLLCSRAGEISSRFLRDSHVNSIMSLFHRLAPT